MLAANLVPSEAGQILQDSVKGVNTFFNVQCCRPRYHRHGFVRERSVMIITKFGLAQHCSCDYAETLSDHMIVHKASSSTVANITLDSTTGQ